MDDEGPAKAADAGAESDDLDLDFDLGFDDKEPAKAADAGIGSDDLNLDFDLELDDEGPAKAADAGTGSDDLDLDFDLGLDDEGPAADAGAGSDDLDLDFDLELDDDEGVLGAAGKGDESDSLGLDFDLEIESDEKAVAKKKTKIKSQAEPALDFDDSDDLFEVDVEDLEEKDLDDIDDLDFGLEDESLEKAESDEFDLSDFNEAVDLAEQAPASKAKTDEDLDFEFELSPDDDSGESPRINIEGDEPDFDGFDESIEVDVGRSDDDDFSLGIDEDEISEDIPDDDEQDDYPIEEGEKEVQKIFDTITITGKPDKDEIDTEADSLKAKKTKKKLGKPILVVLILAILGAGGYFGLDYFKSMGIDIPFIGGSTQPEAPDSGGASLTVFDLDSKFVNNDKSGELFVINGKIKNDYANPRGFIQLTGRLYQPGQVLAKEETVFAGNVFSEMELQSMDVVAIRNQLNKKMGQNRSNMRINPGQAIPFMIVFSDLPSSLEEFKVVPRGSTALKN